MGIRTLVNIHIVKKSSVPVSSIPLKPQLSVREKVEAQSSRIVEVGFSWPGYKLNQDIVKKAIRETLREKFYNAKLWDSNSILITIAPGTKFNTYGSARNFDFSMHERGKKKESSIIANVSCTRNFVMNKGYSYDGIISKFRSEEIAVPKKKVADPWKQLTEADQKNIDAMVKSFADNPNQELPIPSYRRIRSPRSYMITDLVSSFFYVNVFTDRTTSRTVQTTAVFPDPNNPRGFMTKADTDTEKFMYFEVYRKYRKDKSQHKATVKAVQSSTQPGFWELFMVDVAKSR